MVLEKDDSVEHRELREQNVSQGFTIESEELPHGYFTSAPFLGTFVAIGVNLMASTGGFALVAPVLGQINVALGPSASISWLALVYTLCLAVGLLLVGRISDLFGRRWFFVGGTFLGLVGAIIAGTAQSIPVAIGGQTLIGLSACTGYSYAFVMGEIVPVKYRFLANAIVFIFSLPTAGFGAAVSTALILYTGPSWRWVYYLLIILNGIACALYAAFYFPPTFQEKHQGTVMQWVKDFDYLGLILFTAGLTLFILGLSFGGSLYPWDSAEVISFIVIGFLCLIALLVYETFAKLKEPLIPMHLFKDLGYTSSMISLSLGASVYYSQAIIWPQLTANVYATGKGAMWGGWVSCLVGIGITVGEIIGGAVAKPIGKTRYQCIAVMTLATLFLGLMAVNKIDTPNTAMAFVFLATLFVGWNEALVLPICSMRIRDQQEIGTAVGVAGSARSAISTVASTIYTVVLTSRVTSTLGSQVPAALIGAGLPASSVAGYMGAVTAGGTTLPEIPGFTTAIQAAGSLAYRVAYMDAYRTVFYVSIAFGIVNIIVNCFIPNVDKLMTGSVTTTLHGATGPKTNVAATKEELNESRLEKN